MFQFSASAAASSASSSASASFERLVKAVTWIRRCRNKSVRHFRTMCQPGSAQAMQFSIRTLFTLTTIAALLVWVFYVPPQWLGLFLLLLVYCLLPGAVVSGIVYCRGIWQAFFV